MRRYIRGLGDCCCEDMFLFLYSRSNEGISLFLGVG
jgi:hypothetical protein